jgi:hypothetical protein
MTPGDPTLEMNRMADVTHMLVEAQRLSLVHFLRQPRKQQHHANGKKEPDDQRLAEYADAEGSRCGRHACRLRLASAIMLKLTHHRLRSR